MLSILFASVSDALISYAIDKFDPAERVKSWLGREPVSLAFQKSLARTYAAFARQYPEYTAALFDETFLKGKAIPELSKLLTRNQHPDPALLAQAWGESLGADVEFSQRATKPASDFILWLEAELKGEQALQPLFDSRTLDNIETGIEKLTKDIQRELESGVKSANEYEKVTLTIAGDVKDSNIIIGENNVINNYYYSGEFISLNEYYVPPDGVFQRVRVDEFVGRDWLTAKVDAFLNDPQRKSGAFLLIGDAGVGKTSFMAHLVRERRYIHLFAEQVPGQAMLQRALQSLGSQLVTRYQIDPYKDRDTLTQLAVFPDFLERLLRFAVSTLTNGEKIVIVCDALDEAGTFSDGNVFGLPNVLPDGVYLILSQRPVNVKLPNIEPLTVKLEAQDADNLQDMETYLSAVAKRPAVAGQLHAMGYSNAFFIQTLKEKSFGVWMYLHYVIKEIEQGSRAPLDLKELPAGLVGYYADFWSDWRYGRKGRGKGEEAWNVLYAPLLTSLAAVQEAITVRQLIQWAEVKATPREVTNLMRDEWRSFITEKEAGKEKVYAPYHLSFRDFITGRIGLEKLDTQRANLVRDLSEQTVEAHARIVKAFEVECGGEWEKLVEQDYPRLHLSAHLAGAGEYEKMRILLTEGDEKVRWAEARERQEETFAGYLNDLTYVWAYAEREQHYALAIRCMLIENSIRSLASNIPPNLLAELAKRGFWSYARCLSTIRQKSESFEQAESLELLIPDLSATLFEDAFSVACGIKEEYFRVSALAALVSFLPDELNSQVLYMTNEIKNETSRVNMLENLAPNLREDLKPYALSIAFGIQDEPSRADALTKLIPYLPDDLKNLALLAARDFEDDYQRAGILVNLAIYLSDNLEIQVLHEAVTIVREIKDDLARGYAWVNIFSQVPDDFRVEILEEALAVARKIQVANLRALIQFIPHLQEDFRTEILDQLLTTARETQGEYSRVMALGNLIPYLPDDIRKHVLIESLVTVRKIQNEVTRSVALKDLNSDLPDDLQLQALNIAREMANESVRASTLAHLSSYLGEGIKQQVQLEALDVVYKIKDEFTRAYTLANLGPYLPEELTSKAFTAICQIRSAYSRSRALADITPYLPEELKPKALQLCLNSARRIEDETFRIDILTELTAYLPDNHKTEALSAALEIEDKAARARVLTNLLLLFPDNLKPRVLQESLIAAREIKDETKNSEALARLVSHLSGDPKLQVLSESLRAAREIKNEMKRCEALVRLLPHLSGDQRLQVLQESLVAAREIKNANERASNLFNLMPHLDGNLRETVLWESLAAARQSREPQLRNYALIRLVPYLPEDIGKQVQQEALSAAREIYEEDFRSDALSKLLPKLPHDLKLQALSEIRELHDESSRARGLVASAPHLPEKLKAQVLKESLAAVREIRDIRNIGDEGDRANGLVAVVPYITDDLKDEAVAIALEIGNKDYRAYALAMIVPYLPQELRKQLLQDSLVAARQIPNEPYHAHALAAIVPHLQNSIKINVFQELLLISKPGYDLHNLLKKWKEIEFEGLQAYIFPLIKFSAQRARKDGIDIVSALGLTLIHFSGQTIVKELVRAIKDTARWWP